MATIKSDLVTAQESASANYGATIAGDDMTGVILAANVKVTVPATIAANDIIMLVPAEAIPVGAVVEVLDCGVFAATDPGTSLVLDVGTATNDDAFADALDLTAAGYKAFSASGTVPAAIATPYRFTAQEAIYATVKTANTISETVLVFSIRYRAKA